MDGYGNRYIGQFEDSFGNSCEVIIMKKDYTGSSENLVLTSNPVVISKPEGDLMTHIFGTGCKINIVNTGSFLQYSELFGTPEREYYVKILGGPEKTIKFFEGFVLPQMYTQSLRKNAIITIPANDQLSTLKNKKPEILKNSDSYIKIIDIVKEVLWDTGLPISIYVKNGLYNEFYTSSYDADIQAFENTYFDKNLFLEDGESKDSYTILETILKTFGSRVYYNSGRWQIDRLKNHKDLSTYKIFPYDGSTSTSTIPTITKDIEEYSIIKDSGTVEYSAGVKKYELTLNYDLFDNLVNPYFMDIERGDPLSNIGFYNGRFWALALPGKYEWLDNVSPDASYNGNALYYSKNYKDIYINNGIDWHAFNPSTGSWESHPQFASISTKIVLDPINSRPTKKVDLKVEYTAMPVPPFNTYISVYSSRFALRARDESAGSGYKDIWIYFNQDGSLVTTTSGSVAKDNLFESDGVTGTELYEGTPIKVSETIPLSDILGYIVSPDQQIELYLDFFLIKDYRTLSTSYVRTRIGDFLIGSDLSLEENVIEAEIEANYNSSNSFNLDLFDSKSVQLKNSLYFIDSGNNYYPTGYYEWNEVNYDEEKSLQMVYLTDLIQNLSKNRYKFSLDVKGNTTFNLNNLFNYSFLTKDGSMVDMICTGYDHNVKESAYRLSLEEWTDDDGYYLRQYIEPEASAYLTISPSSADFEQTGGGGLISVTSNTNWIAETDYDWIELYTNLGFENGSVSYYVEPIYGLENRIGDIKIKTYDSSIIRYFDISQDSSISEGLPEE